MIDTYVVNQICTLYFDTLLGTLRFDNIYIYDVYVCVHYIQLLIHYILSWNNHFVIPVADYIYDHDKTEQIIHCKKVLPEMRIKVSF